MNIICACPNCRCKLKIAEELIGKKGRCPKCEQNFVIRPDGQSPEVGQTLPAAVTGVQVENQQGVRKSNGASDKELVEKKPELSALTKKLESKVAQEVTSKTAAAGAPKAVPTSYRAMMIGAISVGILVVVLSSYLYLNRKNANSHVATNATTTSTSPDATTNHEATTPPQPVTEMTPPVDQAASPVDSGIAAARRSAEDSSSDKPADDKLADEFAITDSSEWPDPGPSDNGDPAEVQMIEFPGVISEVIWASGGKNLLLGLRDPKELVIFDVVKGKVSQTWPLSKNELLITAGNKHVVIIDKTDHTIERLSLDTGKTELKRDLPENTTIDAVAMGYASNGPLFVRSLNASQKFPSGKLQFYQLSNLEELRVPGFEGNVMLPEKKSIQIRASGVGDVFGIWCYEVSPQGLRLLKFDGAEVQVESQHVSAGPISPNFQGNTIFTTILGTWTPQAAHISNEPQGIPLVPTTMNSLAVSIPDNPYNPQRTRGRVPAPAVYTGRDNEKLIELPNYELGKTDFVEGLAFDYEKRVMFVPQVSRLLTIPTSNDRLVVRTFNLSDGLRKSGVSHLYVTSTPSRFFRPGTSYHYSIKVASSDPDLSYELLTGPRGMRVSNTGSVEWNVPEDFHDAKLGVVIRIKSGAGRVAEDAFSLVNSSYRSQPATSTTSPPTITQLGKPQTLNAAERKLAKRQRSFDEAAFIPKETLGLIVIQPQAFLSTRLGQLLGGNCGEGNCLFSAEVIRRSGLKPAEIERLTLVYNQDVVDAYAARLGLRAPDRKTRNLTSGKLREAMTNVGMGFMNYQETFGAFPRADGDSAGLKTGLSWRVHLLPYLGQVVLYNEFHLDEPWNSEHNQGLISKMPSVFQSPGVTGEGKTSIHVLTGENTLFHGKQGQKAFPKSKEAANGFLAVVAPAGTAEIWTKPGGLPVDFTQPQTLENLFSAGPMLTALPDFTLGELEISKDQTQLVRRPLEPTKSDDSNAVDAAPKRPASLQPAFVVTLANPVTAEALSQSLLPDAQPQSRDGETYFANREFAIWQTGERMIAYGPVDSVTEMMAAKASGKTQCDRLVSQLNLDADYSAILDLESQAKLFEINRTTGGFAVPTHIFGISVTTLEAIRLASFDLFADGADSLPVATVNLQLTQAANGDSALRSVISKRLSPIVIDEQLNAALQNPELAKLFGAFNVELVRSTTVTSDGDFVRFRVAPRSDSDLLLDLLKSTLIDFRTMSERHEINRAFWSICGALSNLESRDQNLPGAGRKDENDKGGLSWRVHLLQYMPGQDRLYKQFHLDESWDSPHNMTLIDKMPSAYRSPGVSDKGKTSLHVFISSGSPFANDATPRRRDFTDNVSTTLLFVRAASDQADVWTKPGGLNFNEANPEETFGKVDGDFVWGLMADGRARKINRKIGPEKLLRLIQHQDGRLLTIDELEKP